MKSRTSSCKNAALRKDFGRFWPVWVGYILCLAILQIVQGNDEMRYWYAANMAEIISVMGLVTWAYALVAAQMLFGDLFNSRMCNGLHALPLKREHWFSAHITAGLLFSLVPTALMTVFSEILIHLYSEVVNGWQIPLYWFAASNLQYLFFFGLAVLCAMCAGSRFAMAVVYCMVNFFSILLYLLVDQLYTPLLRGVITQSDIFELLCPVYQIIVTRFVDTDRIKTDRTYIDEFGAEQTEYIGEFTLQYESWIYIAILAVLGVLLLMAARTIYKRRKLECAGDFLAVRWLEPVFQVVFTVLCAAGFHGAFYIFFGSGADAYLLMGIGLVTGWFAGRMFLERSTRVFRLKNFAGLALLAALIAGSMYVTKLDPLGVKTWTPDADAAESVSICLSHHRDFTTEDPEEIAEILRLHELALADDAAVLEEYGDWGGYSSAIENQPAAHLSITYRLENGMRSAREYYILAASEAGEIARKYNSRVEVVVTHSDIGSADDLRYKMKNVDTIYVGGYKVDEEYITPDFLRELTEAILADCESGALVQSAPYHPEKLIDNEGAATDVRSIYMDIHGMDFFCYLDIYADCENVLAVLEKTNVMDLFREENRYAMTAMAG